MKHPREYDIYRPHEGECPPCMVDWHEEDMLPLDFIRIAKHDATVIGAYRFQPINALMYQILSLRVIEPYRGRGIGRWLLAHALGVIESKGGRVIAAQNNAANQLFIDMGFQLVGENTLKLELIPD